MVEVVAIGYNLALRCGCGQRIMLIVEADRGHKAVQCLRCQKRSVAVKKSDAEWQAVAVVEGDEALPVFSAVIARP